MTQYNLSISLSFLIFNNKMNELFTVFLTSIIQIWLKILMLKAKIEDLEQVIKISIHFLKETEFDLRCFTQAEV